MSLLFPFFLFFVCFPISSCCFSDHSPSYYYRLVGKTPTPPYKQYLWSHGHVGFAWCFSSFVNRAPIRDDFFLFLKKKTPICQCCKSGEFLLKKNTLYTLLKHLLPKEFQKNHHRIITRLHQLMFHFWVDFIVFCGYYLPLRIGSHLCHGFGWCPFFEYNTLNWIVFKSSLSEFGPVCSLAFFFGGPELSCLSRGYFVIICLFSVKVSYMRWCLFCSFSCIFILCHFIGLAYQGKDIVFRFIIEYSS
jgi:hypothetical protein